MTSGGGSYLKLEHSTFVMLGCKLDSKVWEDEITPGPTGKKARNQQGQRRPGNTPGKCRIKEGISLDPDVRKVLNALVFSSEGSEISVGQSNMPGDIKKKMALGLTASRWFTSRVFER